MLISSTHIAIVIACVVAAFFIGSWLFNKDTEIENRRRSASRVAATLKQMGFKDLPEFFIDYSIGDYSGMIHRLRHLAEKMFAGEQAILDELKDVFSKLLVINLKTPEGRAFVKAKLEEAEKGTATLPAK